MKKPCIAGNWKMHKTVREAIELTTHIKRELLDYDQADIVLCPPSTALSSVYEVVMETNIKLGAQNVFWEEEGAYTGEVSPSMVKDCGCEYVIIGHSERRKYFSENDAGVNSKIKAVLKRGLIPIVCVGETLEVREAGETMPLVQEQLQGGLKGLEGSDMEKIIVAYEPVWAIGTGKTATPAQAQEVQKFIREWIGKHFSQEIAQKTRILYGGSIKPTNINALMSEEDVDGGLVGGASLDAESFISIVKNATEQKAKS